MRAQRGRLIALVALLLLESSVGAFLEVSNAESIRELMRDYEEGAVSAKEVQRLLNDYLEELGIAFRLRERVMCVLPSDLNTGIEHRRVEPRAGCSKLQFLSEQGGVFDNRGLLEEVSWGGARALTELEEIWLSEQVLLSALGDS